MKLNNRFLDYSVGRSRFLFCSAFCCWLFMPVGVYGAEETEEAKQEESMEEDASESVGVELGEFFIRDVRGSEGVKTRVSFTIFADIALENEEAFREIQTKHEQRIRDQIILAIRLCQTTHFQEPTLHSLKRRIWVRLYRMIPDFEARGLMFKDFAYFTD